MLEKSIRCGLIALSIAVSMFSIEGTVPLARAAGGLTPEIIKTLYTGAPLVSHKTGKLIGVIVFFPQGGSLLTWFHAHRDEYREPVGDKEFVTSVELLTPSGVDLDHIKPGQWIIVPASTATAEMFNYYREQDRKQKDEITRWAVMAGVYLKRVQDDSSFLASLDGQIRDMRVQSDSIAIANGMLRTDIIEARSTLENQQLIVTWSGAALAWARQASLGEWLELVFVIASCSICLETLMTLLGRGILGLKNLWPLVHHA